MALRCARCLDDGIIENYGGPNSFCDCAIGQITEKADATEVIYVVTSAAGAVLSAHRALPHHKLGNHVVAVQLEPKGS